MSAVNSANASRLSSILIALASPDRDWETAIPDDETRNELGILSDSSVKELPFMIKVSGFQFTPIHSFVPNVQKNDFDKNGDITTFGKQRYIALGS